MSDIEFDWECQPEAERFILNTLEEAYSKNSFIKELEHHLLKLTSTRLFDWLDHIAIKYTPQTEKELERTGYRQENVAPSYRIYHHPGAQLPRIVLKEKEAKIDIALSVDSIADFLLVRGMHGVIEGTPYSEYRRCKISQENNVALFVVERRGTWLMEPVYHDASYLEKYLKAIELWETRPRDLADENEAMKKTLELAEELVQLVGQNLAAWIVLEVERRYWQARNTAGAVQKNRQDRLGMGWANHDHHTFRSSRVRFHLLVRLFEILGFFCRERYYAGKDAGWGAQIVEHPHSRLILFLDVDLAQDEINIDFAHQPIPDRQELGTVGLWCALHGDSILKGGMHHLEAQFMFEELTEDLHHLGIGMMNPFSSFPYLKQAFTAGEIWHVDPKRVEQLIKDKKLTLEQGEKFKSHGAVGSHLENLQRREGYKGFNKNNVSYIIKETDPRKVSQTS